MISFSLRFLYRKLLSSLVSLRNKEFFFKEKMPANNKADNGSYDPTPSSEAPSRFGSSAVSSENLTGTVRQSRPSGQTRRSYGMAHFL